MTCSRQAGRLTLPVALTKQGWAPAVLGAGGSVMVGLKERGGGVIFSGSDSW